MTKIGAYPTDVGKTREPETTSSAYKLKYKEEPATEEIQVQILQGLNLEERLAQADPKSTPPSPQGYRIFWGRMLSWPFALRSVSNSR
jgi:hypothetical protein